MTTWDITHGEILDIQADGLICSANPNLNLSGGVGGAFLLRFGTAMQDYLHDYLRQKKLHYIEPGSAVLAPPFGSPYIAIAHAVAIDAFYDTNAAQIAKTYSIAIDALAEAGCQSIVAACLGCGYGRCSVDQFAKSIEWLISRPFAPINKITFATTNEQIANTVRTMIETAKC